MDCFPTRVDVRHLTVKQPWADLLVPDPDVIRRVREAAGGWVADRLPKDAENRSSRLYHRGWVLIGASRQPDRDAMRRFHLDPAAFTYGAVVGVVDVYDVVTGHGSWWAEHGGWQWLTRHPRRLPAPVPCVGSLGAQIPTPEVWAGVAPQVGWVTPEREESGRVVAG